MDAKLQQQLAEAKACFYSWRLVESYNILRRFFDRLPFRPQKEHAELIGIFIRCLIELGKEFDLKFYAGELERWYEKDPSPHIGYPLAVAYRFLSEPRWEASRAIFERIMKDPESREYHAKTRMMLADYYANKEDVGACRTIVESIPSTDDPRFDMLVVIWKGYVLFMEKRYDESILLIEGLLEKLTLETDWYAYFSAHVILALAHLKANHQEAADQVLGEIRRIFDGKNFKSVQNQLKELEGLLKRKVGMGTVTFQPGEKESRFVYNSATLLLKSKSPAEKLLCLLIKKRFLDKAIIVRNLYQRQYSGEQDDKLIYYHIHALRKRLKAIGLPPDAIVSEGSGYRWVPEVELLGGEA